MKTFTAYPSAPPEVPYVKTRSELFVKGAAAGWLAIRRPHLEFWEVPHTLAPTQLAPPARRRRVRLGLGGGVPGGRGQGWRRRPRVACEAVPRPRRRGGGGAGGQLAAGRPPPRPPPPPPQLLLVVRRPGASRRALTTLGALEAGLRDCLPCWEHTRYYGNESPADTVRLFATARAVVGQHGAGARGCGEREERNPRV